MIQEIKDAPSEERFQKMNAFKKELRAMNAQARKEAILSLQSSLNAEIQESQTSQSPAHEPLKLQEVQRQLQMQHQNQNPIHKSVPIRVGRPKR